MCVRYALNDPKEAFDTLEEQFNVRLSTEAWLKPRYNIALTQNAPVIIRKRGMILIQSMQWGFVGKRVLSKAGSILANARAETVTELPTFKEAVLSYRCIIPVNGFYEFQDLGKRKQPYLFTLKACGAMALAGVWQKIGDDFRFCLLTTQPNALVEAIHDRMPVILNKDSSSQWLNEQPLDRIIINQITQSFSATAMTARRVKAYVNNVRHEGLECIEDEVILPELF
jgi:putative SOS response-associated peptidase YedK